MKKYLSALTVVTLLGACATPYPAETATLSIDLLSPAPPMHPGQRWTYRRIDSWNNQEVERYSQIFNIEQSGKWSVAWGIISSTDAKRLGTTTEEFDATTHAFADPRISGQYLPLQFPLAPGKTWSFNYKFQSDPETVVTVEQTALVTRQEDVTVPAGTFKTLRVEHTGHYKATQPGKSWRGRITETFWYAPEVGRVVAQEYKDTTGWGKTWDQRRDELVEMRK